MNKILKTGLQLVGGSLVVWLAVVLIFSNKITWSTPDTSNTPPETEEIDYTKLVDGVFTGTAKGHNGELVVEVTIENKTIVSVVIVQHVESEDISDPAIEKIPVEIVTQNSTDVDTISGATVSSKAIINATNDALQASIESGE